MKNKDLGKDLGPLFQWFLIPLTPALKRPMSILLLVFDTGGHCQIIKIVILNGKNVITIANSKTLFHCWNTLIGFWIK